MNRKEKVIFIIVIFILIFSLLFYIILDKFYKRDISINNNTNTNNDTNIVPTKKFDKTKSMDFLLNNETHNISVKYKYEEVEDKNVLKYDIYLDNDVVIQNAGEYYLDFENLGNNIDTFINDISISDISTIKDNNGKEYLVFKYNEPNYFKENGIMKIFVISEEKNILAKLEFDLSFKIGSLEGENKELYYEDDLYSQYKIEEDKIRYLDPQVCENLIEETEHNFIETILMITDGKAIIEKRNTHTGSDFSGSSPCTSHYEFTIY